MALYGLVAEPADVENQLSLARGVLPQEALALLSDQVTNLLVKKNSTLGIGIATGAAVTLLVRTVCGAGSHGRPKRDLRRNGKARVLTGSNLSHWASRWAEILTGIIALTALAVVPAILAFLPFRSATEALLARSRWPIMTVFVLFTFCLIYRFAPCRAHGQWTPIAIGAAVAAIIWVLGSAGFSLDVSDIGSYDRIYGSLGAVVVLLIWSQGQRPAPLIGAAIDAELPGAEIGVAHRTEVQPRPRAR